MASTTFADGTPKPEAHIIFEAWLEEYFGLVPSFMTHQDHQKTGTILIKQPPMITTPDDPIRWYMMPGGLKDRVLQDWVVFEEQVPGESAKHTHQGGLIIFIKEGNGFSIVDGNRVDYSAGDVLVLPITPGGVEHQHFSIEGEVPFRFVAFINEGIFKWAGTNMVQQTLHEGWEDWTPENPYTGDVYSTRNTGDGNVNP